ncbi:MAG: DUF5658 family protein [Planctomycetota bacterium]
MEQQARTETASDGENRLLADRRRRPTPAISRYTLFGGRRREFRRTTDRRGYVDRYPRLLMVLFLGIMALSIADAFCTLRIIHELGGSEANPMMVWALSHGLMPFLLIKITLTAAGIVILCLHQHFPVVRTAIGGALVLYVLVSLYHLYLLNGR